VAPPAVRIREARVPELDVVVAGRQRLGVVAAGVSRRVGDLVHVRVVEIDVKTRHRTGAVGDCAGDVDGQGQGHVEAGDVDGQGQGHVEAGDADRANRYDAATVDRVRIGRQQSVDGR